MNNLNPLTFLAPGIALALVVVMFIYLLKKENKVVFRHFVLIILVLAFQLNFAWEVIQMPLYKDASFNFQHIAFCALASVADAIMVLLLYFCFALIYKNNFWIQELIISRLVILILVGGTGAIIAERIHIATGTWSYSSAMPILPVLDVGLSPVLQFLLLPICIYFLGLRILNFYDHDI